VWQSFLASNDAAEIGLLRRIQPTRLGNEDMAVTVLQFWEAGS
jgi:hypothetical protein